MEFCSAEIYVAAWRPTRRDFRSATFSGSLMPLFKNNNLQHNYTTLDCLLAETSDKERLECKVTWHMTCIFQSHSAVSRQDLKTHVPVEYQADSMHGGYLLG